MSSSRKASPMAASSPSAASRSSRRRSSVGRTGRSRARRRQAKELADRLRAQQQGGGTGGESPSASRARRRGSRVASAQTSRRNSQNVPLSKRPAVKISRATLLAFYDGIGTASEGTKLLQQGKLPVRGKVLRTLGYSTIVPGVEAPDDATGEAKGDDAGGSDAAAGEDGMGDGSQVGAATQEAKNPKQAPSGSQTAAGGGLKFSLPATESVRIQDLFMATVKGDEDVVSRFLAAGEPADLRPARFPNETPLHAAALLGNTTMMKLLIDGGAPVNATDMNGNTPLHYAVRGRHEEAVKVLIARQADAGARNRLGLNGNRLASELGYREVAKLLPTTKSLAMRRIRTAGKLRAMMGSLKKFG